MRPAGLLAVVSRPSLPLPDVGRRGRSALLAGLLLASLVAADALAHLLPGGGVFLVLLVPVIVGSLILGPRASLAALALGAVGAAALAVARDHPWLSDPAHLLRLGLYLINGAMVVGLTLGVRRLAASATRGRRFAVAPRPTVDALTDRELEVLGLAAHGLTTKAIAGRLFLSSHTVKSHLSSAYAKLGVQNRAEAVAQALEAGWIGRS